VSKLGKFTVQIFVYGVKTFLELLLGELADGIMCGIVIDIREKNGLRERGLDMLSRTTIPVPTSTNLRGKQRQFSASHIFRVKTTYFVVK
jgi:hypothetical protein